MEKQELISVIVPVYNVEKYLDKCIESIVKQTYKNLEIILVDDGSKDDSGQMCDEWTKKDNRIKVIHKENGGLSSARNAGIDTATGTYIGFVDSDDFINKEMYETLYNEIKNKKVNIVCCNFNNYYDENKVCKANNIVEGIYKDDKKYDILIDFNTCVTVAWNKLYSKKVFSGIRFPIGKLNEDTFVIHKILYSVESIELINKYLYNYRQRSNSITQTYNLKRLAQVEAYELRLKFIKENKLNEEFYQKTLNQLLYEIIQHVRLIDKYYNGCEKNENINLLIEKFKKYINELKTKDIRIQNKFKFLLFNIFPKFSIKIFNVISNI